MSVPWEKDQEDLYEYLLKESPKVWSGNPDLDLLKELSSRISESNYKLDLARKGENSKLIKFYESNLKIQYANLEYELEIRKNKFPFKIGGGSILASLINSFAKKAILSAISPSLSNLPESDKQAILDGISQAFDDSIKEEKVLNKEKIVSDYTVEKLAAELEPLVMKMVEKGDYMSSAFDAVRLGMELVNEIKSMSGEEKKQFVISAFKMAYKKANPDLPWVSGKVEESIEDYFLDTLLPAIINSLWKMSKDSSLHPKE